MSHVADQLREAREARNLTVYQVAEVTKIRTDHIRALDEGNFDAFSAPVYIRGFVRTYATLLKLDVSAVMAQLNEELSQSERHHEHPRLTGRSSGGVDWLMFQLSQVNWRIMLPLAAVALILLVGTMAYRAIAERRGRDPLETLGPGRYQPASPPKDAEYLPLPPP